jgi:hypothetical protein
MTQDKAFNATKQDHPALYSDFNRRLKAGAVGELFPQQTVGGKIRV